MKTSIVKAVILLFSIGIMTSCLEEDDSFEKQVAKDVEIIEQYLEENDLSAEKFNNYIYKIEITSPSGDQVDTGDVVEAIVRFETLDTEEVLYEDSSHIYQTKHGFFLPEVSGSVSGPNFAIASMGEGEVSQFIFTSNLMFWSAAGEYDDVNISPYEIITATINIVDLRTKEEQNAFEAEKLREYAVEKGYIPEDTATADGFYRIILEEGSGTQVIGNSASVNLDYKGSLLDGTVFDKNEDIVFNTGQVIEGFKKGLKGLKKGSKAVLLIPSQMAYGSEGILNNDGTTGVPPFSPLIFEVTINDF